MRKPLDRNSVGSPARRTAAKSRTAAANWIDADQDQRAGRGLRSIPKQLSPWQEPFRCHNAAPCSFGMPLRHHRRVKLTIDQTYQRIQRPRACSRFRYSASGSQERTHNNGKSEKLVKMLSVLIRPCPNTSENRKAANPSTYVKYAATIPDSTMPSKAPAGRRQQADRSRQLRRQPAAPCRALATEPK